MIKKENNPVLISVKPQYANCIVDGTKTIELRKKFPLDLAQGTKLYIYSSSPEQMVIGECEILSAEYLKIEDLWKLCITEALISWDDFKEYYKGKEFGVAIKLLKPRRYPTPLTLIDFSNKSVAKPPQSYQYLSL